MRQKNKADRLKKVMEFEAKAEKQPKYMMKKIIDNENNGEVNNNKWINSIYENADKLKCNNVGRLGEFIVKDVCEKTDIKLYL